MFGNSIQDGLPIMAGSLFLGFLDLFPLCPNSLHGPSTAFPEDVWMSPNQLLHNMLRHLFEIECASLAGKLAMKDDLEQKVSQFFEHLMVVFRFDGIE